MGTRVEIFTEHAPLANIANAGVEIARLIETAFNRTTERTGIPRERLYIRSIAPCSVSWGSSTMLVVTIVAEVLP